MRASRPESPATAPNPAQALSPGVADWGPGLLSAPPDTTAGPSPRVFALAVPVWVHATLESRSEFTWRNSNTKSGECGAAHSYLKNAGQNLGSGNLRKASVYFLGLTIHGITLLQREAGFD